MWVLSTKVGIRKSLKTYRMPLVYIVLNILSIVMAPYMSKNTVCMAFFIERCIRNIVFTGQCVLPLHKVSFWHRHFVEKQSKSPFVNVSFIKTCFSVHIRHHRFFCKFYMVFIHQLPKFKDRLFFTAILNSLKIITFARLSIFVLSQFETKQGLH